ncbi:snare protein syntaxin-like protein 18/UFE1 [Elsinoe ampelina]|uniref:Snare protein syntaxin-like protein 18/UFE1 n=1 Tax=Elsinoe ampelina TaxID=302913 RepID=A0A6A6G1Q7_9PEZI|nr:snare protein syntaxin-like protein 18/UFE1 [Elsinoe ampelina]
MTDVTPHLNALLKAREVPPITRYRYSLDQLDEFLKEAYRIHARIADLTGYLKANRAAYLSTTPASRANRQNGASRQKGGPPRPLTDKERAEIDAHSKMMIRQLNGAINSLSDAEKVRQETSELVANRKRNRAGFGALGRWAAGGAAQEKSPAEELQAAKEKSVSAHREGVVFFLQKRLEEAGKIQAFMIETRLQREEEKAKSVLYKAKSAEVAGEKVDASLLPQQDRKSKAAMESSMPDDIGQQLSEEQMQMFAEENQGMLKHLGQQLDQVRAVHRSLEEISQLQTSLMTNLESQNAHIDQLVQDSFFTEENVGRGNKELKKASEKASTARMLYHGTWIFCAFLVTWDLIF